MRLFRPPCGKLTLPTAWHVRRRGAPLAWWTIDGGDTHDYMPAAQAVDECLAREGGGVVLLHDFDGSATPKRGTTSCSASRAVLRRARGQRAEACAGWAPARARLARAAPSRTVRRELG